MNKQIELVKKWLENPESVSQEELKANAADAYAAAYDDTAYAVDAYYAADYAADAAANAGYAADNYAAYDDAANAADAAADAAYWVKRYEELTK
jgi:hypothetical protein